MSAIHTAISVFSTLLILPVVADLSHRAHLSALDTDSPTCSRWLKSLSAKRSFTSTFNTTCSTCRRAHRGCACPSDYGGNLVKTVLQEQISERIRKQIVEQATEVPKTSSRDRTLQRDRSGKPESDDHKHHKSHNKIDVTKDIDSVPSNVQSSRQEALLFVFEDNEAVIKMIIKGRSPTMRHVSRTHRVALDWLFDLINLDSKIQIKYIDTKNQLADMLTKGNFTRDEWNHLLNACLTLAISVLQFALLQWRNDFTQDSGEGRVTAKSKPMMNLSARMPSVVSSSTSLSPGKRLYGYQDPGKSVVADDRSGKPDKLSSAGYSKLDYDRAWSSQEWKSEVTAHDRSGQPDKTSGSMIQQARPHHGETLLDGAAQSVRYGGILRDRSGQPDKINSQEVADSTNFVMGSDATEFVNKVNVSMKHQ